MKDEKKAPKLRFKGFTDDWEQVKYGEIFQRRSKMDVSTPALPSVEYDDINPGMGTLNKEPKSKVTSKRGIHFNPGDVLFGKLRPYLKNWLFACFEGVAVGDFWVLTSSKIDHGFTYSLIQAPEFQYIANLSSGSKMPRSDWGLVSNARTFIPTNLSEQKSISSVLFGLDTAITLHEDKKRQLERIKSALLQKMFANKSEYPAIRFEGFSAEWEQYKLGDVANFSKGTGYSKSDLKGTGSPIILYGRLYTKYETIIRNVDTFVVPKSGSVFSKGGEVIVPGSGETAEDISIASVVEPAGILLGGDLNIIYPNSDLDPAFLAITISNGKPHFDMARRAQGKSVVHLHNADLKHILLKTPNLSEQKRISKIFESLDQTITLHDQKLSFLKRLKQTLLQKMFI